MADSTTTNRQVVLDLTLTKGNDQKSRRISFDILDQNIMADIKDALVDSIVPSLVGGGLSTIVQPTGWRDYDLAEEEYTCTAVEAELVVKQTTKLDLG